MRSLSIRGPIILGLIFFYLILSLNIGAAFLLSDAESENNTYFFLWLIAYPLMSIFVIKNKDFLFNYFNTDGQLLLFTLVFFFLSNFWSDVTLYSLKQWIALAVGTLFTICLANQITFERFLSHFGVLSWLVIALCFFSVLLSPNFAVEQTNNSGLWKGVFHQKNLLGRYFCLYIIVAIALYFSGLSKLKLTFALLISFFFIMMSGSATAFIVTAMACFSSYLFVTNNKVKQKKMSLFLFITLMLLSFLTLIYIYQPVLEYLGKDATLTGRTIIWPVLLQYANEELILGYGYSSFWNSSSTFIGVNAYFSWEVRHAHNGFVETLLSGGIVGLILMVLLLTNYIKLLTNLYLKGRLSSSYAFFSFAYFVFFILVNISQNVMLKGNSFYWGMFCFMLASLHKERLNE